MADVADAAGNVETFTLARIGTFRTAFPSGFGCPRQGLAAPAARGRVDLAPWVVNAAGGGGGGGFLEGLEEFSHVWVIFVFDQNRHSSASFDPGKSFLRPSVKPPWLVDADGRRGSHGVFATRTPHRPNPVGLTVCRLDWVDHAKGQIFLSGVDVIDGSAVLDVKPYHPVDSLPLAQPAGSQVVELVAGAPAEVGAPAIGSSAGSGAAPSNGSGGPAGPEAHFPDWLPAPRPRAEVRWSAAALERLAELQPRCGLYPDERDAALGLGTGPEAALQTLRAALEEVLGLDPRTPQSRCRAGGRGDTTHRYWALDFDALSVAFRLVGEAGGAEGAPPRPAFEVVHVEPRGEQGARSSKAWLEALRVRLEGGTPEVASGEAADLSAAGEVAADAAGSAPNAPP